MHTIHNEIQQLLEMIPYLDANERTELLVTLPNMSEERKITIRNELWRIIKQMIAKIPMNAFLESRFTESEKEQILRIQESYLHDLRQIEKEMRIEFLGYEPEIKQKDIQVAEKLLLSLT